MSVFRTAQVLVAGRIASVNVASAMVEGAALTLRRPVPSLRPYLGCFWSMATSTSTRLRTMPDACAALSVETGGGVSPKCFFTGPRLAPAEQIPPAGRVFFGVRLLPGVAFMLTGIPVYKLADRRTSLEDVLPDDGPHLRKCLGRTESLSGGIDLLEQFLIARLTRLEMDGRVRKALERIEECSGLIRIGEVARACQVSPRHLNRLLRTWVGFSPKRLARITRFQKLLQRIEASPSEDSAGIAAELGYFDQAHLIKEVGRFTGTSPRQIACYRVADFSKTRCE
jgi:AraC-like DNA-binding protein